MNPIKKIKDKQAAHARAREQAREAIRPPDDPRYWPIYHAIQGNNLGVLSRAPVSDHRPARHRTTMQIIAELDRLHSVETWKGQIPNPKTREDLVDALESLRNA